MIAVYSKVNVFRYASIFRIQVSNPGIVLKKSQNLLNQSSSSVPVLFKVCKVSVSVGRSVSFIPLLLPLQHALHIYGCGFVSFSVSLLLPTSTGILSIVENSSLSCRETFCFEPLCHCVTDMKGER